MWLWYNTVTHFEENAYVHQILAAGLTTDTNHIWTNLNNTDNVIIIKSYDFEKTLKVHINKNGCYQTWKQEDLEAPIHSFL